MTCLSLLTQHSPSPKTIKKDVELRLPLAELAQTPPPSLPLQESIHAPTRLVKQKNGLPGSTPHMPLMSGAPRAAWTVRPRSKGQSRMADRMGNGAGMGAYEYGAFAFMVTAIERVPGEGIQLTWTSSPDKTYAVWSRLDMLGGLWDQETTVASQGRSTSWTDYGTTPSRKFYRIEGDLGVLASSRDKDGG